MSGWIKLHRAIIDWEWYQDPNTCRLFLHLLIIANREDGTWKGVKVSRGQKITSIQKLSNELDLSQMQIRTALGKLKSTGNITDESTNRFRLITVCNYNEYQAKKTDDNNQNINPDNEILSPYQQAGNNKQEEKKKRKENIPYQEIVDCYHKHMIGLPKVKVVSKARKKAIGARWGEDSKRQTVEYWDKYFSWAKNASFLFGNNKDGWEATFDFFFQEKTFTRLIEGGYHKKKERE